MWEITEKTDYTGYFASKKRGLIIGRYSTCCTSTRRGRLRSLSLVGKIWPTTNPNHRRPLETANFITQEDLGGARTRFINDAELRNAPDTTAWRRGLGLPILLVTGLVFKRADRQPSQRQLYPIAELGKPEGTPTRAPRFMRLMVAKDQFRIPGKGLDFRDEILQQIYRRPGRPATDTLRFDIEVSDDGETRGPPIFERRYIRDWRKIGTITFEDAVASFNGDCVLHFNHPTWRSHRDDPSSATRVDGRKIS